MRITPDTISKLPQLEDVRVRIVRPDGSSVSARGDIESLRDTYAVFGEDKWSVLIRSNGVEELFLSSEWEGIWFDAAKLLCLHSKRVETARSYPIEGIRYLLISDIESLHDTYAVFGEDQVYLLEDSFGSRMKGYYTFSPCRESRLIHWVRVEASFVDLKVVHRPDDSTSYLYVMKKEPEL